jgi:ATP-binding cassette subfamily F protein 3
MEIKDLTLSFGTEDIFNHVNIVIPDNEKIGIVGVNGAGKTTLFKIILGRIDYHGKVNIKGRVDWLPQVINDEVPNMNITILEYLMSARPIAELEEELKSLYEKLGTSNDKDIYKKIDKVEKKLEYWDQYGAESEMFKIAKGLHIDDDMLLKKLDEISGGEKSKVAFAHLLYSKPEVILLDEPTNHLDLETRDYVINYLKNYKGTVYAISHDVKFLNAVTSKILYVDKATHIMKVYDGNYDTYLKLREEEKRNKELLVKEQEKEEAELRAFIQKAKSASATNHNLKRMQHDRERKLDKLLENKVVKDKQLKSLKLKMEMTRTSSNIPLQVKDLSFSYTGKKPMIINNLSFDVYRGEKFLIVGENGVGKSTLLKLITNNLQPIKGTITFDNKTDIAYYAQELEILDNNKNLIDNFDDTDLSDKEIRSILGRFLFYGDDVFKKVHVLSPGERSRVALAKIAVSKSNFLILDEPTNHLDPETQNLIAEVFRDYQGTMIVVSHNPEFVDNLNIKRLLVLPEGKQMPYDSNVVRHYKELNERVN